MLRARQQWAVHLSSSLSRRFLSSATNHGGVHTLSWSTAVTQQVKSRQHSETADPSNEPAPHARENVCGTRLSACSGFQDPLQQAYAFASSSTFPPAFARDRVAAAYGPVIPGKFLDDATSAVTNDAHAKHGAGASLFDNTDKRCVLCDVPTVDVGLKVHSLNFMHQARLGIVERAIALVNWHLHLVVADKGQHSTVLANTKHTRRDSRTRSLDRERDHIFEAGMGGLPPLEEARRSPQCMKAVDWAAVVTDYWWSTIDIDETNGALKGFSSAAGGEGEDWTLGHSSSGFNRIRSLSASASMRRKWRIRFLLQFLTQRGVLRDSLRLSDERQKGFQSGGFTRTARFERCEMIGDSVMKYVIHDRLLRIFPVQEGGINARIGLLQQTIDSNPGLLAIYDYLQLDNIVGARLPNTKAKADVVEALFGELQTFLYASETMRGTERYVTFPDRESRYVRAVVEHVMQELAHVVVMWRLEETLRNARAFITANIIDFEHLHREGTLPQQRSRGSRKGDTGRVVSAVEESIDRRAYDPLPLMTPRPRPPKVTFGSGKEEWYFAQHVALTQASPEQEVATRAVSATPVEAPVAQHIVAHYQRGVMRVAAGTPRAGESIAESCTTCHDDVQAEELSHPSLGALRFPQWRQDERERRQRQEEDAHLREQVPLLDDGAVQTLVTEQLDVLAKHGATEEVQLPLSNQQPCPDFTRTPQPPLYTAKQGERLVRSYVLQ